MKRMDTWRRQPRKQTWAFWGSRLAPLALLAACSGSVPISETDGLEPGTLPPNTSYDPTTGQVLDDQGNVVGVIDPSGTLEPVPAPGSAVASNGASSGDEAPPTADQGGSGSSSEFVEPQAAAPELPARTWRLTHEQYRRSVAQLVGIEPDVSGFVPDAAGVFFDNFSSTGFVRVDLANGYFEAARATAQQLTEPQLSALTSCDLAPACAERFIEEFATRAFRRPAQAEEVATYREIYDTALATGDPLDGFRAVVHGVLNSPLFLYRTEIGPTGSEGSERFELTDYEVASLISYSLLDAPPTDGLLQAAARGELTQTDDLAEQVRQLLSDPRAQSQLSSFLTQWLEVQHFSDVEKFAEVFPGFEAVKPRMLEETRAFFEQSARPSSRFSQLLLDPVPAVDSALDAFYLSDPSAPANPTRLGVLALGSVLASHAKAYLTSPTLRGTFVRRRMFCQEITLPPGFTPPPLSETEELGIAKTTRELYERHQTDPSCSVCHRLTDDIGFSLEEFDGAGRLRTLDTTQGLAEPIDSTAMLTDTDVDRPIEDHMDLAQALSESELVRQCFAIQAFRFYFGQHESSAGQPAILEAHRALRRGGTLGELMVGVLSTPSTFSRIRE